MLKLNNSIFFFLIFFSVESFSSELLIHPNYEYNDKKFIHHFNKEYEKCSKDQDVKIMGGILKCININYFTTILNGHGFKLARTEKINTYNYIHEYVSDTEKVTFNSNEKGHLYKFDYRIIKLPYFDFTKLLKSYKELYKYQKIKSIDGDLIYKFETKGDFKLILVYTKGSSFILKSISEKMHK